MLIWRARENVLLWAFPLISWQKYRFFGDYLEHINQYLTNCIIGHFWVAFCICPWARISHGNDLICTLMNGQWINTVAHLRDSTNCCASSFCPPFQNKSNDNEKLDWGKCLRLPGYALQSGQSKLWNNLMPFIFRLLLQREDSYV